MSDNPDELKADLSTVLNSGSTEVTADEAIARARSAGTSHVPPQRSGWGIRSSRGRRLTAISFAVVIGVLAGYLVSGGHIGGQRTLPTGRGGPANVTAVPTYVREATTLPASVFAKAGLPAEISNYPRKVTGHEPLTSQGLPELLYVWASYCPFCAAENWALVMALSRFGSFSGLKVTSSSVSDFAPDTQTLSFFGARYFSRFLVFKSYDLASNEPASPGAKCNVNSYACLQTPSASVTNLFQTLGSGSFPFMDFGNRVVQTGAGYENEPLALAGLTVAQIASQLSDPESDVARAEVGSANYLTAAICALTNNEPEPVCSMPVIEQAESKEGVESGQQLQSDISHSTSTTTPTSTVQPQGVRSILPPAIVPPVSNECTIQLTHDADGNVSPLLCPGGGVNTLAWQHYAKGYVCTPASCGPTTWSKVMQLGHGASATEVLQAMCSDYRDVFGTNPLTMSAEELASAYNGWHFVANNPVTTFEQKGCPA